MQKRCRFDGTVNLYPLHLTMGIFEQYLTINCRGTLLDFASPKVMGILNVTPDSFYDGSKYASEQAILDQVSKMLEEGATIIDVGGMSSRPGAETISVQAELDRVLPAIELINKNHPKALISIDTWRWEVAKEAVGRGASLVNDISMGLLDEEMWKNIASLNVPYILMHIQGNPQNMQEKPSYENVTLEIMDLLSAGITKLRGLGLKDIIIDPGFGFGKTIAQNYQLLRELAHFRILGCPLLIGVSRKSMIHKLLEILPGQALNGTTAVHMLSLINGANILRVHDVKPAMESIKIFKAYQND